jgi:shikimate dehydrogenase
MNSFPRLCCSFAERPSRVGVATHTACYRALGLDFTYVAFAVADIVEAVHALRTLGIRGAGITMPHKLTVLPLLDRLDPVAAQIKSVNTLVNDDGVLTGYNTDWIGARRALEEVTALEGRSAAVVGAGGVARAVVFALRDAGATVHLFNRSVDKAEALAAEFGLASASPLSALPAAGDCDLLVNATSVGMRTQGESLIPASLCRPGLVAFDVVAEPMETTFLAAARAAGATCVGGHRLRLYQAAEQFRLYTGHQAPLDVMEAALLAASRP